MTQAKVVNKYKESYSVYIGRGSKWGNPFTHRDVTKTKAEYQCATREEAIRSYRTYLLNSPELLDAIPELVGETLACYCKPKSCHGDILVEFANFYAENGYVPYS